MSLSAGLPLAAQRNNHWYFGQNAGIRFNPAPVTSLNNSAMGAFEGNATMSDEAGNLLFYTDGAFVYDRSHQVMPNGSGLLGAFSAAQAALILPKPACIGEPVTEYFIFNSPDDGSTFKRHHYSIVNMQANGGLGDVSVKNVLLPAGASERLTAVQHANGRDYWIITHEFPFNKYVAYLLTPDGLATTFIQSVVGVPVPSIEGMLKPSPDGKWLVSTIPGFNMPISAYLLRFDNSTGFITNATGIAITVNGQVQRSYGAAFSPDGSKLYLSRGPILGTYNIAQFNLVRTDSLSLNSSIQLLNVPADLVYSDMAPGPDGLIYVARPGVAQLDAFARPNDLLATAGFRSPAINLNGRRAFFGLPNYYNLQFVRDSLIGLEQLSCLRYRFFPIRCIAPGVVVNWDLGDGNQRSTPEVDYTFQRAGGNTKTITLTLRLPNGSLLASDTLQLTIPPQPDAAFRFETRGCVGDSVLFTGTGNSTFNPIRFAWDFGNGQRSNLQNPGIQFADSNVYRVALLVSDSLGCVSDTVQRSIQVNKQLLLQASSNNPTCLGLTTSITTLLQAANTLATRWLTTYGDGNGTDAPAPPTTYAYRDTGNYTINLRAISPEGCSSNVAAIRIRIAPTPTAAFGLPPVCVTDLSQFMDSSVVAGGRIEQWRWSFGNPSAGAANVSNLQNPSYRYPAEGVYAVSLRVTSSEGCSDTVTRNFTVNGANPKPIISLAGNSFCAAAPLKVTNKSLVDFGRITRLVVFWTDTDSVSVNFPEDNQAFEFRYPVFSSPPSRQVPIRIRAESGLSCKAGLDTVINLFAQPDARWNSDTTFCRNAGIVALAQGTDVTGISATVRYAGRGIQWPTSDNIPRLNAAAAGIDSLLFIATSPDGCSDTAVQRVSINVPPLLSINNPSEIVQGDSTILRASAQGVPPFAYRWSPAATLSKPDSAVTSAAPQTTTTYNLTITDDNTCSSSALVTLTVRPKLTVPNAFSPNGDGLNDTWRIAALTSDPSCRVTIFDRYGKQVFASMGYNTPWDGSTKGNPLPAGTYYYLIQTSLGDRPLLQGAVTVLR